MPKSSIKGQRKPGKPTPDFPLYSHRNGQWAKKIRGRTHFFGVHDAPDDALEKYLDQRADLLAGRTPRTDSDGLSIRVMCNHFLAAKEGQWDGHIDEWHLNFRKSLSQNALCKKASLA
jgi:hypothetical protein